MRKRENAGCRGYFVTIEMAKSIKKPLQINANTMSVAPMMDWTCDV